MASPLWNRTLPRLISTRCTRTSQYLPGEQCFRRCYASGTTPSFQKAAEVSEISNPEEYEDKSLNYEDYFGVKNLVTVKDMFDARVHYGHKEGLRNEFMSPYIFGSRLNIDIIDLRKTLPLFQDALNFTAHIAYRNGVIMFISRQRQTMPWVEQTAVECGEYAHCRYWKGGTFTNANNLFSAVTRLPDLCIFVNTQNSVLNQHSAVKDSAKLVIPTVGIVDTDCDPRLITYPVPGNDDTPEAVLYYLEKFKKAILIGKAKRKDDGLEPNEGDKDEESDSRNDV